MFPAVPRTSGSGVTKLGSPSSPHEGSNTRYMSSFRLWSSFKGSLLVNILNRRRQIDTDYTRSSQLQERALYLIKTLASGVCGKERTTIFCFLCVSKSFYISVWGLTYKTADLLVIHMNKLGGLRLNEVAVVIISIVMVQNTNIHWPWTTLLCRVPCFISFQFILFSLNPFKFYLHVSLYRFIFSLLPKKPLCLPWAACVERWKAEIVERCLNDLAPQTYRYLWLSCGNRQSELSDVYS